MKERINLTQFEDHSPAPWIITEKPQEVVIPANHESTMEMRLYTGSGTNSRLIAKAPELIAELKKCYEELDALRIGLNMAHKCLADHNFRQCHECGDHYHDDYGPLCGHTASE